MKKIRIKVIRIGYIPYDINFQKITNNNSALFEVDKEINDYSLPQDSQGNNWEYTDSQFKELLPSDFEGDFLFAICNTSLENNYYARRLTDNRIIFSLSTTSNILKTENIPIENLLLRMLYAYSLNFIRYDRRIPSKTEKTKFAHDETKGCLFDMNGYIPDIVHSCDSPIICDDCSVSLSNSKVPQDIIKKVKKELAKIKKNRYYKILTFVKKHPFISIMITFVFGLIINIVSNIIWELFIKKILAE
ncbi:MAG: hypothetical protein A2Y41_04735 [Spirochaetes bacterium GWB1_36_13]|nr:MAG: hypothetical protein A2Y41_04735 [Spirochaetes bacterium GWB1_36_13]